MERTDQSEVLSIGSPIPEFSLPNVDGSTVDASYFADAKASLVVFTCNHCPYVKGSEDMMIETIRSFQSDGLKAVAICSNDAEKYPDDSFEKMKQKAAAFALPFPYLHDEGQEVARRFDAACTPELFLFDGSGRLAYHGTVNNNPKDAGGATENYLEKAVRQVLAGEVADPAFVHPLGCSIKWK